MTDAALPFTGERYTPECVREISYEHWHRYAFAHALAKDKRVLDAACGEGYGSALLAQVAAQVTGVDIDATSIAHAAARYGSRANLRFLQADVTTLDDLPARSFDLIVSFETLEHLAAQERLLDGFARLLAADGVLLVSTPDKQNYNAAGEPNPFHVRELERGEFEALLAKRFPARRLYAQKLLFQSALWALDGSDGAAQIRVQDGDALREGFTYAPLYYLAACARDQKALDGLPALSLYGDAAESVYAHYNAEVRKTIAGGARIAELEAEVEALRRELRVSEPGAIEEGGIRAVVVTHRSATTIVDCLQRLLAARGVVEIVVVDNGSDDATVAVTMPFVENEPRVTLQANPDNPGFAFGCNQGAAGCAQPWLAFVNPDCLVEVDTFGRMLVHAATIPEIGALGCVLADEHGVEDPASHRRDPSLREILFAGGARATLHVANDGSSLQRVDAISGALMLMPTAVFREVGGFDAGYRLHVEDLDLCRRVRNTGYEVAVANDVCVNHLRGVSSRSRPLWVEWQKHRGLWRYFRKFEAKPTSSPMCVLLWCALWAHFVLLAAPRSLLRTTSS